MRWLNTFLESTPIDARLLGWWAAGQASLSGWLYYMSNLWDGNRNATDPQLGVQYGTLRDV